MNTPTDIQIIKQNGMPAFVVVPYDEYIKLFPDREATLQKIAKALGLDPDQLMD